MKIIPALQKFPSLSLTIAPDDFYGPNGIYQNPQSEGSLWERPVSAELISHDDSEPGFKINAGLRVQGGSSRNPDTPKHSMSLRFDLNTVPESCVTLFIAMPRMVARQQKNLTPSNYAQTTTTASRTVTFGSAIKPNIIEINSPTMFLWSWETSEFTDAGPIFT
jgi:hypothetical protein